MKKPQGHLTFEQIGWAVYHPVYGTEHDNEMLPPEEERRAIIQHMDTCNACKTMIEKERARNPTYKMALDAEDKTVFWREYREWHRKWLAEHQQKDK